MATPVADMTTQAFAPSKAQPSHGEMRFVELYSGRLPAPQPLDAPARIKKFSRLRVSSRTALGAARGGLMALGIEAAAALLLYGICRL
jgi:hypothetical protein